MEDEQQQILQAIQSGELTGDLLSQIMQAIYHIQEQDMRDELPPMYAVNQAIAEAETEGTWDDELLPIDAINQAIAEAETEGMWVDELPPMEAIAEAMEHASR